MRGDRARKQRVAVGRRVRRDVARDGAARAPAIVDHDLRAERVGELPATMRAIASVAPPAGLGATRRIGRTG